MRLRHGMDVSVKEDEERDYTKEALDLFKAIEVREINNQIFRKTTIMYNF